MGRVTKIFEHCVHQKIILGGDMKYKSLSILLAIFFISTILVGCGVPKDKYDNLLKEKQTLQAKYDNLLGEKTALRAEFDKIVEEKIALRNEYDKLQNEKNALRKEYDVMVDEKIGIRAEYDKALSDKKILEERVSTLEKELKAAKR